MSANSPTLTIYDPKRFSFEQLLVWASKAEVLRVDGLHLGLDERFAAASFRLVSKDMLDAFSSELTELFPDSTVTYG